MQRWLSYAIQKQNNARAWQYRPAHGWAPKTAPVAFASNACRTTQIYVTSVSHLATIAEKIQYCYIDAHMWEWWLRCQGFPAGVSPSHCIIQWPVAKHPIHSNPSHGTCMLKQGKHFTNDENVRKTKMWMSLKSETKTSTNMAAWVMTTYSLTKSKLRIWMNLALRRFGMSIDDDIVQDKVW